MPRKLAPLAIVLAAVALTGLAGCKKDKPEDDTAQAAQASEAKRDNVKRALQYRDQRTGWTPKPICAVPPCETGPEAAPAATESKD